MTSFYRFLLLRIEEASEKSEWGCQKSKTPVWVFFWLDFQYFQRFVSWVLKTHTVSHIYELLKRKG